MMNDAESSVRRRRRNRKENLEDVQISDETPTGRERLSHNAVFLSFSYILGMKGGGEKTTVFQHSWVSPRLSVTTSPSLSPLHVVVSPAHPSSLTVFRTITNSAPSCRRDRKRANFFFCESRANSIKTVHWNWNWK